MLYFLLSFLFAIVIAFLDESYSSLAMNGLIIILGMISLYSVPTPKKSESYRLFAIIFIVYITVGFIFSRVYLNGGFFYSADSVTYLETYLHNIDYKPDIDRLLIYYTQSEGKDILYHELLHFYSGYGNSVLGGATEYYMTLLQSLFGILSCLTLYKILVERYPKQAYNYTLSFSILSFFLLYSSFIIRDIVIAYFFMVALRILTRDFKYSNVALLILLSIITAGIRLQSGLFYVVFTVVYIYYGLRETKYKTIAVFMLIITSAIVIAAMASSIYYEETLEVLDKRQEGTAERVAHNEGLYSYFFKLPMGIRQVALLLYTQLCPFPPYNTFIQAETFPQYFIGGIVLINAFFWVGISCSLISFLFISKVYKKITVNEMFLLVLAAVYIIALTAQPDIRRMIPVYPIIYLLYLKGVSILPTVRIRKTKTAVYLIYISLLLVYMVIK